MAVDRHVLTLRLKDQSSIGHVVIKCAAVVVMQVDMTAELSSFLK